MKRAGAIAAALVALLVAAGCSDQKAGPTAAEFQEQRAMVVERQKQMAALQLPTKGQQPKKGDDQPGASMGSSSGFAYNPVGRRDPFRSFILDRLHEDDTETKGPLEEYDLSQLEVAGLVWKAQRRRALVIDPSGQGYVVEEGDKIGKNNGRVLEIGDSSMLVREEYVDFHGEATTKEIQMRIRQSQGG